MSHAFRVAILTGSDTIATLNCVRRILDTPGVAVTAVMYDRGVLPLKLRLRRMSRRAKHEGVVSYLSLRALGLAADLVRRALVHPFDATPIRRTVFSDEVQSVRELCRRHRLPYIAVDSLNDSDAKTRLAALDADLGIVIGTRILKPATFTIPRLGSINLHKGRVPRYRGMPPAFWELFHGEKEAGATVHFVTEKLDAGPIVVEGTVAIGLHETEHSLRQKLDDLGARLLRDALEALAAGRTVPHPQPPTTARAYTAPTRRERAMLERRLDTRPEPTSKRLAKQILYALLLFGGPVAGRNLWLRLRRRTRYTVLLYHRVNDLSHDNLTTSVDRFIHHLWVLHRRYRVVSLVDAVEAARAGRFLAPNVVVITFDDGYADNAAIAAPILKHFGLPASFFVAAGLVGTGCPFPHDGSSPYVFTNLTWDQLRSLKADGFEVGSHGWSHLNLARCSLDEARREITQSRELLVRMLGVPPRSFAYPYGGREDITPAVLDEIVASGFEVVVSAYTGANVSSIEPCNVLRTGVNDTIDGLTLRALVEGVTLAALREAVVSRRSLHSAPLSPQHLAGASRPESA